MVNSMVNSMLKSPARLVNPYIGTLSHLLASTVPEVMLPHSYVRTYPLVSTNRDYYCNEIVEGFPLGNARVMVSHGQARCPGDFTNTLDHSLEETHPYGNRIELEEHGIIVESTVTAHVHAYRFTHGKRMMIESKSDTQFTVQGQTLRLFSKAASPRMNDSYVYVVCRCAFTVLEQSDRYIIVAFDNSGDTVEVLAAVSYLSFDKAMESYAKEADGKSFDILQNEAFEHWDRLLSRVKVTGNTTDTQVVFYTALYRSFKRMVNYAEHGQYYSGYDNAVHTGDFFYTEDGLWDTFRCMHPLQLLLEPGRQKQMLESYILMYRQSGLMPSFPHPAGDMPVMIGFHAAAIFADAAAKGLSLDYETAYEGLRKNAMEQSMLPWVCNQTLTEPDRCYHANGFFPALDINEAESVPEVHPFERRQAVAVTLEHAYDDWCLAQLARHLGKNEDYAFFMKRSENYKKLYNPEIGWMAPKNKHGEWVKPFDPKWGGGQGGRAYFAENNAWVYTWSVFHDIAGLAELMGGYAAMMEKLDRLFTENVNREGQYMLKSDFLAQFPDATGLMGQFSMGNEPAFHIPYLYAHGGAPWKTQKRLRDILDIWFTPSPYGICGDEDGGAMSSFYVFSALGFYPVCPGSGTYTIGTPLFDEAEITLENGATLKVVAHGAGDGLRYIQKATLHGRPLEKPFFSHADIANGGEIVFEMGKRPNKAWGA